MLVFLKLMWPLVRISAMNCLIKFTLGDLDVVARLQRCNTWISMHRKFADSYWAHSYQGTPSTTLLHEEIFKNVIALLMQHVQSQISFPEMDLFWGQPFPIQMVRWSLMSRPFTRDPKSAYRFTKVIKTSSREVGAAEGEPWSYAKQKPPRSLEPRKTHFNSNNLFWTPHRVDLQTWDHQVHRSHILQNQLRMHLHLWASKIYRRKPNWEEKQIWWCDTNDATNLH